MVQAAMYFVLGVLTAGLLALLVMPAIWRRTARLTRKRIESSVPMTMAEIQADRDQLRAEFAITARKLEMTVDHLRDRTSEQVIEINRQRAEIVRLSNDRNDMAETIEALEERAARLVADLAAADERLSDLNERVRQREATLAERDSEIAALQARLNLSEELTDEQKLELVARNTEIGNLNDRLADAKVSEEGVASARDKLAESLAAEQAALSAERRRVANLEASLARIEAERIDRLAELERRAEDIRELGTELATNRARAEDLAARVAEFEAERVEHRNLGNRATVDESMLADGDNTAKAIAAAEAENAVLVGRLAALEAEHADLSAENENLRRVASSDWDIETENAMLRKRLAGVAADVLQLTSPQVETASAVPHRTENGNANGRNGSANGGGTHPEEGASPEHSPAPQLAPAAPTAEGAKTFEGKTLAQRLRALQHSAARH